MNYLCIVADHSPLTNTLRKKAWSIRSRIARGPSYSRADDKSGVRSQLIVRTGSFSDTNSSDCLTKKSVSCVWYYTLIKLPYSAHA